MPTGASTSGRTENPTRRLVLGDQITHRLRRAHQRSNAIFADTIGDVQMTPTQWAVLVTLEAETALSQNQLGRATHMDPATTQGVIMRLLDRELVERRPDPQDRRRTSVTLSRGGAELVGQLRDNALLANERILEPLSLAEREQLLALLQKLM